MGRRGCASRPVAAVERTVLNGFSEMGDGELLGGFEVGDRAGDLENAVVSAGRESLLLHGTLEQAFGVCTQLAVGADLARGHLRVRVDLFAVLLEALTLALAGSHHAGANLRRAFGRGPAAKLLVL